MIVALDMQLAYGTATGIGEYARGLANALRADGAQIIELAEPALDPWRFDRRVVWDQVLLPQRARASHAQLLHCTAGTMPLHLSMPVVVTVHDVAWLKVQQHTRPYARYYFGRFSLQRYHHARAIVVDSEFSRNELLDVLPSDVQRVHVIYPGVASEFARIERAPSHRPFVLVPGTVERRKNLEVLIRALAHVPDLHLVAVGPFTPYHDECSTLAERLEIEDRVEFLGYVERERLLQLYAQCALVAVPSLYEGFGYAAAQALCAGVPLAVSNRASLPEVAGDDALVLDAQDDRAWAQAFTQIVNDPQSAHTRAENARARAQERFAWSSAAKATRRVYESAV